MFDTWLYCHTEEENRLYNTTNSNPQPTTCTAIGGGGDDDSGDNGAAAIADSIIDGIISYAVDSRDPAYWLDPANWIDPAPAYANPDYAAARAKASARVMVNLRRVRVARVTCLSLRLRLRLHTTLASATTPWNRGGQRCTRLRISTDSINNNTTALGGTLISTGFSTSVVSLGRFLHILTPTAAVLTRGTNLIETIPRT